MAFKGFFNAIKKEVANEVGKRLGVSGGGEATLNTLNSVLDLLGGVGMGSGSSSGGGGNTLQKICGIIQQIQGQSGGLLPEAVGKYLPAILRVAEIIGRGMGDDTPRTEQNADGSFIDDFVKTIIGGRKIHGGKAQKIVKPVNPDGHGGYDDQIDARTMEVSGIQDFEQIRNECLSQGSLFEDPEFPAEDASVYFSNEGRRNFQWLRPHEICSDPSFAIEGTERFDVVQGELGDCWLLAAVANLTLNSILFNKVVPEDNSFEDRYAGIFHFRFWQYGSWVDVVVNGKLMFMHSSEKNEFWSALLEKAYAKLHGSYEALKGGTTCEALEDFTGGITEMYDLHTAPTDLLTMMLKAFERGSFLGCSIEPDPNQFEATTESGLVRGHAYSVTDIRMLDIQTPRVTGKIPLIRIRNPWGNETEWKGAWSDGSPEWTYIDDNTKEEIGLTFDADGEFWMSFKDFMKNFDRLEFCNLSPDALNEEGRTGQKTWAWNMFEGAWICGQSAGGCRNYLQTFATNPQYIVDLEDADEDGKCTFIVALMQKNRRAQRKNGVDCLTIGFAIYRVDGDYSNPLPAEFFKYNASVARSPTFINLREVCSRFKLLPGKYCIVPSTFEPNEEGEFIIRVFTEGSTTMTES